MGGREGKREKGFVHHRFVCSSMNLTIQALRALFESLIASIILKTIVLTGNIALFLLFSCFESLCCCNFVLYVLVTCQLNGENESKTSMAQECLLQKPLKGVMPR